MICTSVLSEGGKARQVSVFVAFLMAALYMIIPISSFYGTDVPYEALQYIGSVVAYFGAISLVGNSLKVKAVHSLISAATSFCLIQIGWVTLKYEDSKVYIYGLRFIQFCFWASLVISRFLKPGYKQLILFTGNAMMLTHISFYNLQCQSAIYVLAIAAFFA